MDIPFDNNILEQDVYRTPKNEILQLLNKHGITCKEEDTVADLRPILAALKSIIKLSQTNKTIKELFHKITVQKLLLDEQERQEHKELALVENFLSRKINLYDNVTPHHTENIYEPVVNKNPIIIMSENIPLISAGTFNGLQSENPQDFLDRFQVAATSNKWTEDTKLNLFPAHLSGTALAWFKHYKNKQGNNQVHWDTLSQNFTEAFTPLAQSQNLQAILENRIQGDHEPTLNFFLEILTTCRRYDPAISDKQIIQFVIQGLKPDICERVISLKNDTLSALEENLKLVEQQVMTQNRNREKYDRARNRYSPPTHNYQPQNYEQQTLKTLQTEIQTLTNLVANLTTVHYANNKHRDTRSPSPYDRRPSRINSDPQNNSQKRVSFSQPNRSSRSPSLQKNKQEKFCTICKKDNHNTDYCWFKQKMSSPNPNKKDYNTNQSQGPMFCRYCKRSNHNIETCFRSKYYKQNQQKNVR